MLLFVPACGRADDLDGDGFRVGEDCDDGEPIADGVHVAADAPVTFERAPGYGGPLGDLDGDGDDEIWLGGDDALHAWFGAPSDQDFDGVPLPTDCDDGDPELSCG